VVIWLNALAGEGDSSGQGQAMRRMAQVHLEKNLLHAFFLDDLAFRRRKTEGLP
jgi:hypothetical protein